MYTTTEVKRIIFAVEYDAKKFTTKEELASANELVTDLKKVLLLSPSERPDAIEKIAERFDVDIHAIDNEYRKKFNI